MKKIASLSIAAICLSLLSSVSIAAVPGFYAGAGAGLSVQDTPDQYIFSGTPTNATLEQSRERGGLGGRAYVGYNFNEYFGLEGSYARIADSNYKSTISNSINNYNATIDYTMNTYNLVGKAYLPLGAARNFNLYALAGVAYVNSQIDVNEALNGRTLSKFTQTNNKFRPTYGVGASYDIPATNISTNLEFAAMKGEGDTNTSAKAIPNAGLLSLNVSYNFS